MSAGRGAHLFEVPGQRDAGEGFLRPVPADAEVHFLAEAEKLFAEVEDLGLEVSVGSEAGVVVGAELPPADAHREPRQHRVEQRQPGRGVDGEGVGDRRVGAEAAGEFGAGGRAIEDADRFDVGGGELFGEDHQIVAAARLGGIVPNGELHPVDRRLRQELREVVEIQRNRVAGERPAEFALRRAG